MPAAQRGPGPPVNPWGALTDVPGVLVGHATRDRDGRLTGCTVVVPPPGTVGGVDVAGGGPATCETDALAPGTVTGRVDAVLLTGGSAFGLPAVSGVQRWCEQQGRGFDVGVGVVPVVPVLALFDLGRGGDPSARPTPEDALEAATGARGGPVATGGVGAGTGALCAAGSLAGGVGTGSVTLAGGVTVGALVVVNAAGSPVDPADGRLLAASAFGVALTRPPAPDPAEHAVAAGGDVATAPPRNTTLVVVATDATLDGAACTRMAAAAQAGLARSLDPVATLADGDAVVALATGERPLGDAAPPGRSAPAWPGAADRLGTVAVQAAAATATAVAVADAVLAAGTLRAATGDVPCYRERYPSLGRWSPS